MLPKVEIWAPDERASYEAQCDECAAFRLKRPEPDVPARWHQSVVTLLGIFDTPNAHYAAFTHESMPERGYELIAPRFVRKHGD